MSINKGVYTSMPITSSLNIKDHNEKDTASIVQSCLLHLLACNFISLAFVLHKLYNEIFGGFFFGFLSSFSFLRICSMSLSFCLPLSLLVLRVLQTANTYDSAEKNVANNTFVLVFVYIFNTVQSLGLISLTYFVNSDAILIGVSSTIFVILQLLVLYFCCNSNNYRKNRISRVTSLYVTLVL